MAPRNDLDHVADDFLHLVGQRATVGVAKHDPACAFVECSFGASEREFPIGLVAVEEVLAIEQHLAVPRLGRAHAVTDRSEIFFRRCLQGDAYVVVPGLRDETDRIGAGIEQRSEAGIVRGGTARPTRHAEGGEDCGKLALLGKQLRIGQVRAGIAAFDVIDADLIEHLRDGELVVEREIDAIGLRPVAQRRIEQVKALAGHGRFHQR